jgi:glycosyltransferase involved in cell wall biosynthesis
MGAKTIGALGWAMDSVASVAARSMFGRRRRSEPSLSVVVPVYDVAAYLPACLDSILGQSHRNLQVVVVDDGSPDGSGAIVDAYAGRDPRVHAVHIENRGLGAARNEGLRHVTGSYVAFADSDDVVPAEAYATLVTSLEETGSDLVTGSILRWEAGGLVEPPWMRRLHNPARPGIAVAEHPEVLGDVFAWNKVFRRTFWDAEGLSWAEGVRYEDQPTTTRAYLAASSLDVLPDHVYHWRVRHDGTSITQQRSSVRDLTDRLLTKRLSLAAVEEHVVAGADPHVLDVFLDRVLAGDLHRYFAEIPGCSEEWWELLHDGIAELWQGRSLVQSGLLPEHRLVGWLVEQGRREEAAAVMTFLAGLAGPPGLVEDADGPRVDVPVIDMTTVDPRALALRPHEVARRLGGS